MGKGSYLEKVTFDGEDYWALPDEFEEWYILNQKLLASDSSERGDY